MRNEFLEEDLTNLAEFISGLGIGGSSILITGATGFIGSLCVKALVEYNKLYNSKIDVIAVARNAEKVKRVFEDELARQIPNTCFVYQNIKDDISDAFRCDYIIHTANPTNSMCFITKPVEVIESIYQGTKHILDFGKKKNARGIVYLSSMEVFGCVDSSERVSEEETGYIDFLNIRSCYSEGKRIAELLCKSYAVEYGVNVKIARLAQTFGPGTLKNESRVFVQFARSIKNGEDIILHTPGLSTGNYCYTRDALKAIFLLLTKGNKGESFTVANESATKTIAELAQFLIEQFPNGKSRIVFDIPEDNIYGYAPDTNLRLSAKKLENLGWHAEINLREMFARMLPEI